MSSKTSKSPKISEFFSPKVQTDKMEGTKSKKRPSEASVPKSPIKKAKKSPVKVDKKKKKKDPNQPKRACSAYIYFTQHFRAKIKEECARENKPMLKVNELAKKAGEAWKTLTDEDKMPFTVKAEADKARYVEESGKHKQKKKDSDKPKRAPTAYFLFLADFRKEMVGKAEGRKIPELAGERWRSMTPEDKKKYEDQVVIAKKEHEAAMKEYNARKAAEVKVADVKPPKEEKKPAKKPKAKPPPPPPKKDSESEEDEEEEDDEEEEEDEEEDEEDEEEEESDEDDEE